MEKEGYGILNEMKCNCVVQNRLEHEEQREWMKRWMCQFHWIQTDYYQDKLLGSEYWRECAERQYDENVSLIARIAELERDKE